MPQPDREDLESDAMLTVESHRDTRDALNHEFHTAAAARTQQLRDDENLRAAARDEATDELDDHTYRHTDDLGTGLGY